MPLRHAEITRHAWLRFFKRWEGEPPECYRTEMTRLVEIAIEENLAGGAVIRMIKNGFQGARYFMAENWRFVTNEEVTMVMTIERPYYAARAPMIERRQKQRRRS